MSQSQADFSKLFALLQNIEKKPQKLAEPTAKEQADLDENVVFVKDLIENQRAFENELFAEYEKLQVLKQKLEAELDTAEMMKIDNLHCRKQISALNRQLYNYEKHMQQEMERLRGEQQALLTTRKFPFFNGKSDNPEDLANQQWILQPFVFKATR